MIDGDTYNEARIRFWKATAYYIALIEMFEEDELEEGRATEWDLHADLKKLVLEYCPMTGEDYLDHAREFANDGQSWKKWRKAVCPSHQPAPYASNNEPEMSQATLDLAAALKGAKQ